MYFLLAPLPWHCDVSVCARLEGGGMDSTCNTQELVWWIYNNGKTNCAPRDHIAPSLHLMQKRVLFLAWLRVTYNIHHLCKAWISIDTTMDVLGVTNLCTIACLWCESSGWVDGGSCKPSSSRSSMYEIDGAFELLAFKLALLWVVDICALDMVLARLPLLPFKQEFVVLEAVWLACQEPWPWPCEHWVMRVWTGFAEMILSAQSSICPMPLMLSLMLCWYT